MYKSLENGEDYKKYYEAIKCIARCISGVGLPLEKPPEFRGQRRIPVYAKGGKRKKASWTKVFYPKEKEEKERRKGKPRTDKERTVRHKELYGTSDLPPRGTRFKPKQRRY